MGNLICGELICIGGMTMLLFGYFKSLNVYFWGIGGLGIMIIGAILVAKGMVGI